MRKFFKILLYTLAGLLIIIISTALIVNSPWGQNIIRGKAEGFLTKKLNTEVRIGFLGVGFPKYIVLNNIFARDKQGDTLIDLRLLKVDISMLGLLHRELNIQQVIVSGLHSHVYRHKGDTTFNFTYVVAAFASKKKPDPKTDTPSAKKPFAIHIEKVNLGELRVNFNDSMGGTQLAIELQKLQLSVKKLDIDRLFFHINELSVTGLAATYKKDTSLLPKKILKDTTTAAFRLVADNVNLNGIQFGYEDDIAKLLFSVKLGALQLALRNFDLEKNVVDVARLNISNTEGALTFGRRSKAPAIVDSIVKIDSTEGWQVSANDVLLGGVAFTMNNENAMAAAAGVDYRHLSLTGIALHLQDFRYGNNTVAGTVQHLALKEKSGVDIRELKTRFVYNDQGATLNDLLLETPSTILRNHLEAHYSSIASLKKAPGSIQLKIDVQKSSIGFRDILLFAPQLSKQEIFARYPNSSVKLDATVTGRLDNLYFSRLYVLTMNSTELELKGHLAGLPVPSAIRYNLHITKLTSSRDAVRDFIADTLLKAVRLPDNFTIAGNVAGTLKDYTTDINITTTDGNAYLKGYLKMSPGKGKEQYNMLVQTFNLNAGRLLKKDSLLGPLSAAVQVKGIGFDPKTMTASITGAIGSALVKNYKYHDISFAGSASGAKSVLTMRADDSNLRFQLKAAGDFTGKYPGIAAVLQIDSIDLHALKVYDSEFRARGLVTIDFPVLNADYPQGSLSITQPVITLTGKRYFLDSLYLVSAPKNNSQDIKIDIQALRAHITGHTPLTQLGSIIKQKLERQYAFVPFKDSGTVIPKTRPIHDTNTTPSDYDLRVNATVSDGPLLHSFVPGLTYTDTVSITASLAPNALNVDFTAPEADYGTNKLINGKVTVKGTDSGLIYQASADQLGSTGFSLWYADIHGILRSDQITAFVSTSDSFKKERFALAAVMLRDSDKQIIQLQQGLKLNYMNWAVAPGNQIVLQKGGYYINGFSISNGGQAITANSTAIENKAPLKINVTQFDLLNIASIISTGDTPLATGIVAGELTIEQGATTSLDGDLRVNNLTLMGSAIGDINVKVNNRTAGAIATDIAITGNGNDINVAGNYYPKPKDGNNLDFVVNINAFALQSVEKLAMGQIHNSSGTISGKLTAKGTLSQPQLNGSIKTNNLRTTISTINSTFRFPAEEIQFADNTISFNRFNIIDSPSNSAVINGTVDITNIKVPVFDINVNARNWRAVHSTAKDNKTFYGDLYINSNIDVRGTATSPSVDGSLNILKGTNLTIVTPEKNPQIESRKGIVMFVNLKDTNKENTLRPRARDTVQTVVARASDVNVNITVDKNAQFSMIIDQASGDFISVRGVAALNASVSKNGTIGLTGNYELADGAYQLNYNFIKRRFKIKNGSTITFAGDPVQGTIMDVTAVYQANVAPYDLVQRQITDQSQLNYYKQRVPFDVLLHLKGAVLQPAITFDIDLPDNKMYPLSADQLELVKGSLSQIKTDTSQLNKQVFAVLILNRFVAEDPFSNGASQSVSTTALQSVSTFIGEQLNQAAGKLVHGVDLSVDLATTEDYTSGDMRQRTDLSLAASKRLLDDRLKLTIGNNFELEGPQTSNQETSYLPSNLAADYQLTEDGRYTMRAYRQAYNKGVLEGFITETGLNFIVSLDYNRFSTLFRQRRPKVLDSTRAKK